MNRIEIREMKAAGFGPANPMPDIGNVSYIRAGFEVSSRLSEEDRRYLGRGMIRTVLPYCVMDNYDRDKRLRPVKVVTLENEYLRAEFLPEYGGRLWSLVDKETGVNALYTNSVLQPCNFAILNAWFSGGVEFNIGIKGHTPLTCSPMHCELIGEDGVRFFGFERIREVAYSITAVLPKGSRALYIRPCIENTSDREVPMYWWSNIAFPETEGTRVIVPASESLHCLYSENHYLVDTAEIPFDEGVDVTYPLRLKSSTDYFFKIPAEEEKWIAAVDPNGTGLLQYSDRRLRGRKLFLWGNRTGGRHWNEFLSAPGEAYIEIQAGLATTQLEHLPMPAHSVWTWTEGYAPIAGNSPKYYGAFDAAVTAVRSLFEEKAARGEILGFADLPALDMSGEAHLVSLGSDFGALENEMRKREGKAAISEHLHFPRTDGQEGAVWRHLLETGVLPCPPASEPPVSYQVGEGWRRLLEDSVKKENGAHWYAYNMLGVARYAAEDIQGAEDAFLRSVAAEENVFALRNLAMLSLNVKEDGEAALAYMQRAYALAPARKSIPFLKDYARMLTDLNKDGKWAEIYMTLPEDIRANGRLSVYYAKDLYHLGRFEEAADVISEDFVLNDVKEGELALSALWRDIYAGIEAKRRGICREEAEKISEREHPLPYALDFRMHD